MKLDKNNWAATRLEDVAYWYQKDIPNSQQEAVGVRYYLTADHIDSDAVTIKRYSELSDGQKGPTITKHFEKGDLLFSTRSTALHKAAIAPVAGVTGEKLLVIRVKSNSQLISELLPFVMQSAHFWDFAINSAAGSVNKFTSWTKIKEYKFLLPPIEQQARIAELLSVAYEVEEKYHEASLITSTIEQLLIEQFADSVVDYESLESLSVKPIVYGIVQPGPEVEDGVYYVQSNNLNDQAIQVNQLSKTSRVIASQYHRSEIEAGNLLFSLRGNLGFVREVPVELNNANIARGVARVVANESRVSREYLILMLNSAYVKKQLKQVQQGSTFKEISIGALRQIRVPVLTATAQKSFVEEYSRVRIARSEIEASMDLTTMTRQVLINQIFSA